jgi:curved DNA-binding protein CbpA
MFKDYYAILEIDMNASQDAIKAAYRKQAIKWHPDRNKGIDTTEMMQFINEAYLILKDVEAKERYDREYKRFKEMNANDSTINLNKARNKNSEYKTYTYPNYHYYDKTLQQWVLNAAFQAIRLAKDAIIEFAEVTTDGIVKGTANAMGYLILTKVLIGVFLLLIFILGKACN